MTTIGVTRVPWEGSHKAWEYSRVWWNPEEALGWPGGEGVSALWAFGLLRPTRWSCLTLMDSACPPVFGTWKLSECLLGLSVEKHQVGLWPALCVPGEPCVPHPGCEE